MYPQYKLLVTQISTKEACVATAAQMDEFITTLSVFIGKNSSHWNNLTGSERHDVLDDLSQFTKYKDLSYVHLMPFHMLLNYNSYNKIVFSKYLRLLHDNIDNLVHHEIFTHLQARYTTLLYSHLNPKASKKELDDICNDVKNSFKEQTKIMEKSVKSLGNDLKKADEKKYASNKEELKKLLTTSTMEEKKKIIKALIEIHNKAAKDHITYKGVKFDGDTIPESGYVFENINKPILEEKTRKPDEKQ
jgi:hypothetical protein